MAARWLNTAIGSVSDLGTYSTHCTLIPLHLEHTQHLYYTWQCYNHASRLLYTSHLLIRYRHLERGPTLPSAAESYSRGVTLSGLSKAYGLAGLRLGWLASQDEVCVGADRQGSGEQLCNNCTMTAQRLCSDSAATVQRLEKAALQSHYSHTTVTLRPLPSQTALIKQTVYNHSLVIRHSPVTLQSLCSHSIVLHVTKRRESKDQDQHAVSEIPSPEMQSRVANSLQYSVSLQSVYSQSTVSL